MAAPHTGSIVSSHINPSYSGFYVEASFVTMEYEREPAAMEGATEENGGWPGWLPVGGTVTSLRSRAEGA